MMQLLLLILNLRMRLSRYIFNNHQDMTDNEKRACLLLKVMSNSNINEYFVEYEESGKINDSFREYLKQIENLLRPRVNHNT